MTGDVLISSGVISYLRTFTSAYPSELGYLWMDQEVPGVREGEMWEWEGYEVGRGGM